MSELYKLLEEYEKKKTVRMHMPGHKGNANNVSYASEYDITEITGFDNLHGATGVLKQSMDKAAKLWHSEESFYLVNGSTCGILAAVRTLTKRGDTVICARNCHKSVFNALELCGVNAVFVMPEYIDEFGISGAVKAESVEKALMENPQAKLVIITSPTYEGIISDMEKICSVAHFSNAAVLLDEAHGAHLDLSDCFQGGGVKAGCDIVVQSLHKTLSCPTQTAILHVQGKLCDRIKLRRQLSVFQTSSPSYLFMSAIDGFVNETDDEVFLNWSKYIDDFYEKTSKLEKLKFLHNEVGEELRHDKSKITVFTYETEIDGYKLAKMLREEYNIEVEMAAKEHIIAMTGSGDTEENLKAFAKALIEIDRKIEKCKKRKAEQICKLPQMKLKLCDAAECEKKETFVASVTEAVCGEFVWAYPPGIPLLIPGEVISADAVEMLRKYGDVLKSDYEMLPEKIMII